MIISMRAAAVVLAAGVSLAFGPAMAQSLDELHKAARAEGKVIFGGAIKESVADDLAKAFARRYPGVQLNYTRRSTEPMVQMIEAERKAGKVSFDLLNVTEPADLLRWRKEAFIAAFPMPDLVKQMLPDTYDKDGYYYSIGITPMYGVYNTRKLKPAEAPKSLKALTSEPRWVGQIAISRPVRGGTSAGALLNVATAIGAAEILKKAPDLKILLTRGNEAALTAVSSGERLVSWGVSGYRALEAKQDGEPIELIFWEEGVTLAHFSSAIPAKAPNPNAARLLLAWLMSAEGQKIIVEGGLFYSPRRDVTATPAGQPALDKIKTSNFSFEKVVTEAQKLAQEFDKAVGLN